jgi:hypothetical protein
MGNEMFDAFVKTFEPSKDLIKPDDRTIRLLEALLPKELTEFWKQFGFGNYGGGLVKIINPLEYTFSLYEWLGIPDPLHRLDPCRLPILMTGFGDIFYYRELYNPDLNKSTVDVSLLNIHYRKIDICTYSLSEFFKSFIVDDGIIRTVLKKELFKEAEMKMGSIGYEEIYFFAPALVIGGAENLRFIDKGIANVHHTLLFQMGASY